MHGILERRCKAVPGRISVIVLVFMADMFTPFSLA